MTTFEQGYKAFLDGVPKDRNPFDEEKAPHPVSGGLLVTPRLGGTENDHKHPLQLQS